MALSKKEKHERKLKREQEKFDIQTENIGRQSIKCGNSKTFKDHYQMAVSGFDRTLRAAKRDEQFPQYKLLSITEQLILEGKKRKANRVEKTDVEPERNTPESVDAYCKKHKIGTYHPDYVPSKPKKTEE